MPLYPVITFNANDRQRTDANFDLTAVSRYSPTATLEFDAGYARKSRSPNLYERYAWSANSMAIAMVNLEFKRVRVDAGRLSELQIRLDAHGARLYTSLRIESVYCINIQG